MHLYIVYDYDDREGQEKIQAYFMNIYAFINVYRKFSTENTVSMVNNKKVVYDSRRDQDINVIVDHPTYPVTAGDIAYSIMRNPDEILICSMHGRGLDFKNIIKCMKVAKENKLKIHSMCPRKSNTLKLISNSTGGLHMEDNFYAMVKILSTVDRNQKHDYEVKCHCCSTQVHIALCCPVCLTIYCKFTPICKRCKSRFDFKV